MNEIENKNKKITLIAGIINASQKMLYWKTDLEVEIGEYAIVENTSGYDLIKIIGKVETTEYSAGKFSNTKYENMKKIVMNIGKID